MVGFLIGLFLAHFMTLFVCAISQVIREKNAVKQKVVYLDGKFYTITEMR